MDSAASEEIAAPTAATAAAATAPQSAGDAQQRADADGRDGPAHGGARRRRGSGRSRSARIPQTCSRRSSTRSRCPRQSRPRHPLQAATTSPRRPPPATRNRRGPRPVGRVRRSQRRTPRTAGRHGGVQRKAPEARDVRALMDGEAPWASETHPRVALGAEGPRRELQDLRVRSLRRRRRRAAAAGGARQGAGGDDASSARPSSRARRSPRARDPVVAPLAPGAARLLPRSTPLGPDEDLDAAARRGGGRACARPSCWTTAASEREWRERRRARACREGIK